MLSAFAINVLPRAKADSGFDTSYDSGGSWGGDSGGSDFDSGSSGNGKYTKNSIIILVIILIAMPSFVIYTIFIDLYKHLVTSSEMDPFFLFLSPLLCGKEAYKNLLERYVSLYC